MKLLLKLDESLDKDIVEWLARVKDGFKTSEIKAAIRLYMGNPKEPSLTEIINELRAIKAQIDQIKVVSNGDGSATSKDEPEKASRNVDDLLSRLEGGEFG
jgi:hypothetical protein